MAYQDVVLALNPIAYWRCNESNTPLQDSTANNRDASGSGLTYGHASLVLDPGGSVFCGGSNDYLASGTLSAFSSPSGQARSFVQWIRTTTTTIGRCGGIIGGGNHLTLTVNPAGNVGKVTATRLGATIVSSVDVNDDTPHCLVITDDGSTGITFYLDGASVGTGTRTSNNTNLGQVLCGVDSGLGTDYNGYFAEVAVFDYALSGAEALAIYEAGTTDTPDPQFVAIDRITETNTAQAIVPLYDQFVAIGQIAETNTARDITPLMAGVAQFVPIARINEYNAVSGLGIEAFLQPGTRVREGMGFIDADPVVAPPPANIQFGDDYLTAVAFTEPTMTAYGRPVYSIVTATRPRPRMRITVDGQDVTYHRGVPTPIPSVQFQEPCSYGPGSLTLPAVMPNFEELGTGATAFLRPLAPVILQQLNDAGTAVERDVWRGVLMDHGTDGRSFMGTLGGEVSGPMTVRFLPIPLTRFLTDVGQRLWQRLSLAGVPVGPYLGPVTGIEIPPIGHMWEWDAFCHYVQQATDISGVRWAVLYDHDLNEYRIVPKDTTTVHATLYVDGVQIQADLRRDFAAEPTRVFATAILPNGMLVNNAKYPGIVQGETPPYPFGDNRTFGEGTSDDTPGITSYTDGVITAMLRRLRFVGALSREDLPGGFDADVTAAIRQVQREVGLAVTGNMTPATWNALYDVGGEIGYNALGSAILPMAQRTETRRWNRTQTGIETSLNPNYDPNYPVVDLELDMGTGPQTVAQVRQWAQNKLVPDGKNWAGQVTINGLGLIRGEHDYGDPLSTDDIMPLTEIWAGMNIMLRNWDGGTLVHMAGGGLEDGGRRATLQVDTQARDLLELWTVIERDRESRKNLTAAWRAQERSSALPKDSLAPWNHQAGWLGSIVRCPANRWTVFALPAGQAGTVSSIRLRTRESHAEYVCAVFGVEVTPEWLGGVVPSPLSSSSEWGEESKFDRLDNRLMLYSAGTPEEPLGYGPGLKGRGAPLTGRHVDDASFSYRTYPEKPVLWVAVFPDRACYIPAGRVLWAQIETGS